MYGIIGLKPLVSVQRLQIKTPLQEASSKKKEEKLPIFFFFFFLFCKLDMRGRPDFTVNEAQRATA